MTIKRKYGFIKSMFLFHYFYNRKKDDPPFLSMFYALLNLGVPFTIIWIDIFHILDKTIDSKIIKYLHNINRIEGVAIFILPVIFIIKICNDNIKELEQIELSDSEYSYGRMRYIIFLALVVIYALGVPPNFLADFFSSHRI